ncbi:MAG: hypothetical protein ONB44_13035 [candidate division KSB1 bacterium]|nr:hypothetical protein [candidate division KSB1 bacterium]MDZ7303045.1 hypothetical protein [candidate division KSB1 bacterium]MDZ7312447.1 hypothetical protein [candidate division KSB1 bacterium]
MDRILFELLQRFEKLENEVRTLRHELNARRLLASRTLEPRQAPPPLPKSEVPTTGEPKRKRELYSKFLAQTLIDMGYSGS